MLKEFVWGTPEEIQAHQTVKELSKRRKLNPSQQTKLDEAKPLSRRFFIRRGISTVVGTAAGTAVLLGSAAYALSRPEVSQFIKPQTEYKGPIDKFQGLEYLPRNSLSELLRTLENMGHPILDKVAQGIKVLSEARTRPQEFPDWIDEGGFPFPFVQDNTNTFTTSFYVLKSSGDRVKFVIPSQGATEPQEGIDKL